MSILRYNYPEQFYNIILCKMQYEFITFSGMAILGSQGTYIDFKGFFGSRVRKFAKIADFGGIYSADASPTRAFALGAA